MKMKYRDFCIFAFFLIVVTFISCGGNNKQVKAVSEDIQNDFLMTEKDTIDVLNLCDSCMNYLKAGQLDQAIGLLYTVESNGPVPICDQRLTSIKKRFSLFPVLDYSIVYIRFNSHLDNQIKYDVKFTESNSITGYRFSPVKYNDKWYLTVEDK